MNDCTIKLHEWDSLTPAAGSPLANRFWQDKSEQETAAVLTQRSILEITELKDGLHITSNSYVGKIRIGSMQIDVLPKLEGLPLYRLLKYAYSLSDLQVFSESVHDFARFPFFDLLVYQLILESEALIARGVSQNYVKAQDELTRPTGRVDMGRLAHMGGLIANKLPCIYHERTEDNLLNRVLLAGLHFALSLVDDRQLKIKLHRICSILSESIEARPLTYPYFLQARNSLNRLNSRYEASITIIGLLLDSQGIQLVDENTKISLKGFFFDMNRFFQALLSKLLHEYLDGFDVRDEYRLHSMFLYLPDGNPQHRRAPTPRPDFAIMRGRNVVCLLDAKYRDLWATPLPRDMLYQLAIYAVSGKGNAKAKILYPTMTRGASIQKIAIESPITGETNAEIILQPLFLPELAILIEEKEHQRVRLTEYMREIVFSC